MLHVLLFLAFCVCVIWVLNKILTRSDKPNTSLEYKKDELDELKNKSKDLSKEVEVTRELNHVDVEVGDLQQELSEEEVKRLTKEKS